MTGQKVAAIPDQPKTTNQNTVLVGDKTETIKATKSAKNAKKNVTSTGTLNCVDTCHVTARWLPKCCQICPTQCRIDAECQIAAYWRDLAKVLTNANQTT